MACEIARPIDVAEEELGGGLVAGVLQEVWIGGGQPLGLLGAQDLTARRLVGVGLHAGADLGGAVEPVRQPGYDLVLGSQ